MKFTKMQGIGNDYIYFDCTKDVPADPQALAVKLSDRHFGIGSDGIILIMKSDIADFRMRMFNADGSEGKMCGNASRCIAKYVYEKGMTDKTELTLETLSGIKYLSLDVKNKIVQSVTVNMGKAEFSSSKIPVISDNPEIVSESITVFGKEYKITCVSMGNPHCVIFTDEDISTADIEKPGKFLENNKMFPERTNVEFVNILSRDKLAMRVWERGSGETLACGTGACGVVSAAVKNGLCDAEKDITVVLRGGELIIKFMPDNTVLMKGPAEFVFEGEC